jgi:hypothetical protein
MGIKFPIILYLSDKGDNVSARCALSEQYCSLIPKLMAQLATLIKINAPCSLSIILGPMSKAATFNAAKYRSNRKAIANYLNDALATDDSAVIRALGNLSRAHGMGAVAEEEIAQVYTDRSAATWIQRSAQY